MDIIDKVYSNILVQFSKPYKKIYMISVIIDNDLKIKSGTVIIKIKSPGLNAIVKENGYSRPSVIFETREGYEEKCVDPSTSEINFILSLINNEFKKNRNIEFIETYDNYIKIIKKVYEKIQP